MQAPPPEHGYVPPRKPNYLWLWLLVGAVVFCGCIGLPILAAILFPVFSQARLAAVRTECLGNVKQLSFASLMYSYDFDDHLPFASNWSESIGHYVKSSSSLHCPAVRKTGSRYGYAVNSDVVAMSTRKIADPSATIWIFETSDLRPNASGKASTEMPPNRHGPGRNEGYVDGHAKWVR